LAQSIKAVIWDLDGVLVDSGEIHYLAFAATLPNFGIAFSRELFAKIFGMGNREALEFLTGGPLDQARLAAIIEQKETTFRRMVRGRARPLDGAVQWLAIFKEAGVLQALASSAPQENIDALMDELGLRGYFQTIISAPGNDLPGKPDPAVFLEAARRLEVDPTACVVLEDSTAGIEAAKRAGMLCIAVTTTNVRENLLSADYIVDTLASIQREWLLLPVGD
jgi:beta-phosphoglucomutase